jgi:ketosteroid isomerase-like protein
MRNINSRSETRTDPVHRVYNCRMHNLKAVLLAPVALLVMANPGLAQTDPKDDVLNVEAAYNQARLQSDIAALDHILADDYVGISQWGDTTRNKQDVLKLFQGSFKVLSLVPTGMEVRVNGDAAVICGQMNESNAWKYRFVRTYIRRQGRWQLLAMAQMFQVDPDTMKVVQH